MTELLGSVWWWIVSIGLLVTFHEYGHYWVAKRCGVKVLRFSVGFGKPLWMKRDRDGTEFAVAAIPLGGYVKMLDERETEVAPEERHRAFNNQSVYRRIAIAAAGFPCSRRFRASSFIDHSPKSNRPSSDSLRSPRY